jgi:DNA-directed RNA polymerase beta subunit
MDEYEKTPEITLFRKLCDELGAAKNTIATFDDWVNNCLPKQVEAQSFQSENEETGEIVDVIFRFKELKKPQTIKDNEWVDIYPRESRLKNTPYSGRLIIYYICGDVKMEIECGQIPIMLGSEKCHLHGKTPEEMIEMGECISDPLGYFLIKSEMSLITQEKSRTSIPIVSNSDTVLRRFSTIR